MRTAFGFLITATSFLASGALAGQQAAATTQAPPLPWAYPVAAPAAGGGGGGGGGGAAAAGRGGGGGGGAAAAAGRAGGGAAPAAAGGGGGGGAGRAGGAAAPAGAPAAPAELLSVPGSTQKFTAAQTRNGFDIADWRPDLHPPMPEVVSKGRSPDVRACGFCHMATGYGRPENASLAGQPAAYIIQQMADFKNDLRVSAEPRMGPPRAMIGIAKGANDEEVRAAAAYFAATTYPRWIRVVETNTVPKTNIVGGMFAPTPDGATEAIGARIVEVPENLERTELRDPGSSFIAYVPTGAIAKGRALATTGGGKTVACATCHGNELKGLGPVPALAGRSPSYVARQLYDLQSGVRKGTWSPLMKAVVQNLTPEDILNIVAYTASLQP